MIRMINLEDINHSYPTSDNIVWIAQLILILTSSFSNRPINQRFKRNREAVGWNTFYLFEKIEKINSWWFRPVDVCESLPSPWDFPGLDSHEQISKAWLIMARENSWAQCVRFTGWVRCTYFLSPSPPHLRAYDMLLELGMLYPPRFTGWNHGMPPSHKFAYVPLFNRASRW